MFLTQLNGIHTLHTYNLSEYLEYLYSLQIKEFRDLFELLFNFSSKIGSIEAVYSVVDCTQKTSKYLVIKCKQDDCHYLVGKDVTCKCDIGEGIVALVNSLMK